ncbi:protoheme IX farnesyltransferase [Acinetobacter sp. NCu2D-2]|uniref:heme o synthase n=1 Tax=Acinetobacter sp. NCu2D-2 TaxID=1608473 RepID=UPI0007CDDFE2|nr:heme o synthase [Acinetobacter sp. NCu2D-2]ANF81923.1 protoheme IX farnesyltransferase [Acinetobacter sp. NCu2D-2]
MLKKYLFLTKPGILFGNFVTALGGYFVAAQGSVDFLLLLITLLGTLFVVASGCVINNVIDQDIDSKMQRTQNRAMVQKSISIPVALAFAFVLGLIGFSILWFWVNAYAFLFAVIGFVVYVGFYSLWTKRTTIHQTIVGSISGAAPPVIGYTAVANQFDMGALLVFLGYALWQMPHSWGIAIYRFDDYKNAGIPILPVARSIRRTKIESLIYVVLFCLTMNGLFIFGYANWIYMLVLNAFSLYWVYLTIQGFKAQDDQLWAKQYFMFSVKLITVISVIFSFTSKAPSMPIVFF